MHMRLPLYIVVAVAVACVATSGVAFAHQHQGADLHCNSCHILHASYNGTMYGTGGPTNPQGNTGTPLLKGANINETCLSCHGNNTKNYCVKSATGTAAAPTVDVTTAGTIVSPYKNSAGWFQSDYATAASGVGHDLKTGASVTAVQGTWVSGGGAANGMTCTDCHDAHGTSNYCNLQLQPGTAGAPITVGAEDSASPDVYVSPTLNHFDTDAVAFKSPTTPATQGMVAWCEGCHTNITSGNKHPQNAAVSTLPDGGANWIAGTSSGNGFGAHIDDAGTGTGSESGIPRVRFQQAGSDFTTCSAVGGTNQVFCLTCHKSHGSKYDSGLVWPYVANYPNHPLDQTSGCDQCHNKGA